MSGQAEVQDQQDTTPANEDDVFVQRFGVDPVEFEKYKSQNAEAAAE